MYQPIINIEQKSMHINATFRPTKPRSGFIVFEKDETLLLLQSNPLQSCASKQTDFGLKKSVKQSF